MKIRKKCENDIMAIKNKNLIVYELTYSYLSKTCILMY